MSDKKGCRRPKSENESDCTLARPSSNLALNTFWNALLLTIEFRTEERSVAGLDNRRSKPVDEPSPSSKAVSGVEVVRPLKLSAGCQLKSIKSLLKALKIDTYELDPNKFDEKVILGELVLVKI